MTRRMRSAWMVLLPALLLPAPLGAAAAERLLVVASIPPLAEFVRIVGGELVQVETLTAPGQNEHDSALRPSQMVALDRARLLVLNGLGLEPYAARVHGIADARGVPVLLAGDGLAEPENSRRKPVWLPGAALPRDEGPYRLRYNPHVWLDPLLALVQVARIRDALSGVYPQGRVTFEAHAGRFTAELLTLHAQYEAALRAVPRRTFIAYHGAYVHLARRYGLTQIEVVPEAPEQEPSPARVADVIALARTIGARVIFAELQFPEKATHIIAEEAGLRVGVLDPIGAGGRPYLEFMRANLAALVDALQP